MTNEASRPVAALHPGITPAEVAALRERSIRAVLPLIPAQKVLLRGEPWPVLDPFDFYTFRFHQKVIVRVRRFRRWLESRLGTSELSEAGKGNLITLCLQAAATIWRLEFLLRGKGPWLVHGEGGWSEHSDIVRACAVLYPQLSPPAPIAAAAGPSAGWKASLLEWRRANLLRGKNVLVASSVAQGFIPLTQQFLSLSPDTWLLKSPLTRSSKACRADVDALRSSSRQPAEAERRQSLLEFQASSRDFDSAAREVRKIFTRVDGSLLRLMLDVHGESFVSEIAAGESLLPALTKTLVRAKVRHALFYDIAQPERLWLAEAARRAGVERWQFAHMVVANYANSATLWEAYERRVTMLAASPFASVAFAQSPTAYDVIERIRPAAKIRKSKPVIWCPIGMLARAKRDPAVRVILFAGNYDAWSGYQPIIHETADDYVAGMIAIANAAAGIPSARLVIRFKSNFKSKSEIDGESIAALLPANANWEIRQGGSFYDDLAQSDMLVSFSSSVIEEAIHLGFPVLLWSGRMHYRMLKAQDSVPRPGSTSAVYACRAADDLKPMLEAVLDCHANRELTDAERAPYVWRERVPGRNRLARELAGLVK